MGLRDSVFCSECQMWDGLETSSLPDGHICAGCIEMQLLRDWVRELELQLDDLQLVGSEAVIDGGYKEVVTPRLQETGLRKNTMLVLVLMVTALFVSDVAGKNICLEVQQPLCKPQDCDEGWFYFPSLNSCYRYFNIKKTWQEAEEFCNQLPHYGNLATVTSPKHNTFISSIILAMDASKPWTWIGLNDIWKEGTFTWSDGTSYIYRSWNKYQPDDFQNSEDCVHILYGSTGYGCWNDLPCDSKLGFVCAYKLLNV